MVTQIKEYTSAQAIAEALDKQLSETKSVLGEYLRKLDDIRTLAEKSKKNPRHRHEISRQKTLKRQPQRNHRGHPKHRFRCNTIS
jgi:hypothetical protein